MPFAPDDLSDLVGWYEADQFDAGDIHLISGEQRVDSWINLATGMGNLGTATATKPYYEEDPIGIGLPGARFDVAEALRMADASGETYAQPNTIFVVGQLAEGATLPAVLIDGLTTGRHYLATLTDGSGAELTAFADSTIDSNTELSDSWPQVVAAQFNGASSFIRQDSVETASGDVGTDPFHPMWLGSRSSSPFRYFTGWIFAVLVYNAALSEAETADVENYLRLKWQAAQLRSETVSSASTEQPTPAYGRSETISLLFASGFTPPLQGLSETVSAGTVSNPFSGPLQGRSENTNAATLTATNYQHSGVEGLITLESHFNPQISVPLEVPAGITPRVFKRKHITFD